MGATRKADLERQYNVPVYVQWRLVPKNLHTRTYYKEIGVSIPKNAKPDAIKGGGQQMGKARIYFLFKEENWIKK